MELKTVVRRNYEFSVTQAHRKQGYVIDLERKSDNVFILKRSPGDPRWQEVAVLNSDVVSPRWPTSMQENAPAANSRIELSPDWQVLSLKNSELEDEEDIANAMTEIQSLFGVGKHTVYQLSDTTSREQYPEGRFFIGFWVYCKWHE